MIRTWSLILGEDVINSLLGSRIYKPTQVEGRGGDGQSGFRLEQGATVDGKVGATRICNALTGADLPL